MKESVPAEVVTATWESMWEMPVDEAPRLMEKLKDEQPVLLAFLLAAGEDLFNRSEKELILYIGIVIWQIMKQSKRRLGRVTRKKMDQALEENEQFIDVLSSDTEADFDSATIDMLATYPEPQVLRYILETVIEKEEDPDEEGFRDEVKGMAYFYLKTALDALIRSLLY